MNKLGAACAILAGASDLAAAMIFYRLPPEQSSAWGSQAFYQSVAQSSVSLQATYFLSAVYVLLAIGVVIAVSERVKPAHPFLVNWAGVLAIIGFAIAALQNVTDWYQIPSLAQRYMQADPELRRLIEATGMAGRIDPDHWLQLLCLGFWFLVVHGLALRHGLLPKGLAGLGLVMGGGAWLAFSAGVAGNMSLYALILVLALVVILPAWFFWLAVVLWRG
jgi:hypothetical protein